MSETEPEHVTPGTGSATTDAETDGDTTSSAYPDQMPSSAERERDDVQSMFGGLGPAGAANARWARRDAADPSDPSSPPDPRIKLARGLLKRAETGDVKAYDAWSRITTELEQERLSRDGADGAEAWERLQPEQRRWLLALLEGGE